MKTTKPRLEKTECACAKCQSACEHTPGWFRPGEAEKAAKFLKLSMPVFFRRYLGVNWYSTDDGPVFVLAPALKNHPAGREYPGDPRGTCVFFTKDRRCRIHAVKPFECSHGSLCVTGSQPLWKDEHVNVTVPLWKKHQGQIVKLLGSAWTASGGFSKMNTTSATETPLETAMTERKEQVGASARVEGPQGC